MVEIERAVEDDKSDKGFYIILFSILGVLLLLVGSLFAVKYFSQEKVYSIDDLHALNLDGKLEDSEGYIYNGFSFVHFDNLWYTKVAPAMAEYAYEVPLHYAPRDTEDVFIHGKLDGFNIGTQVYIVVDPRGDKYMTVAASELAHNIAIAVRREPVGACSRNETQMCHTRPIVTCENADKSAIILEESPGPELEYRGKCVFVRGEGKDLLIASTRLLFDWYDIQ